MNPEITYGRGGYTVNPPMMDEATGQYVGEPQVIHNHSGGEETYQAAPTTDRYIAPVEVAPLSSDASDDAVRAFWTSSEPLTEQQVAALQTAYMRDGDENLANLLQYKLTGDVSLLTPEQVYELGIGEADPVEEISDEDFNERAEAVIDFEPEVGEESQQLVLQSDLSEFGDAGVMVQGLAMQVVSGNITNEQAMQQALDSGLNPISLYAAYESLWRQTNR